jgi:tetratricopeptide (TPR) repeat protein
LHFIPIEITPPKNEADFERMCVQVYGVVFKDPLPKTNGRSGQGQNGVDIFVKDVALGRIGIQCKKYTLKPVKWTDVTDEVKKADTGRVAIKKLILATTALNDAVLLKQVQELSDEREEKGLFTVEIEFWGDICNHIDRYPVLQDSYSPNSPGASFYRTDVKLSSVHDVALQTRDAVLSLGALPGGRDDSANRLITTQLDHTNVLLKAFRYRDALDHLAVVGADLQPFDNHQKARWSLQKGLALWLSQGDDDAAADLFLASYALYPDDERMAAANIRALMLKGKIAPALEASNAALERFPESDQVWYAHFNLKLIQGDKVTIADVPKSLEMQADALQFVAQAELKAGNLDEAIRLIQLAASDVASGFFVRATALRIAIHCGSILPPGAMHGVLPERERNALEFATSLFEPKLERLWSVQSEMAREATAHLGYAFLMLGRYSEALSIVNEAEINRLGSAALLRVHVIALSELEKDDEVQALATRCSAELDAEGVATVGQVAANHGNLQLLNTLTGVAAALNPPNPGTVELLGAMRWEALDRAEQRAAAVSEILKARLDESGGLISCCVAGRVLNRAGLALEAEAIVSRARNLVVTESDDGDKLMLAELLFNLNHWDTAAKLFENLLVPGTLSELHNRTLTCYVKSKNRRKAKELIGRLPGSWHENDRTRQLAIELGQQAGDWEFLKPLVAAQVKKHPDQAGSWLFKLGVSLHSGNAPQFQADLRDVPEVLEGQIKPQVQLAGLELRYGEVERGMRRLYRLVRANMDEPEALSAYFISIMGSPGPLPYMETNWATVEEGSAVTLSDGVGPPVQIVIDPASVGPLPKRDGYCDLASPIAQALLGAEVGEKVQIPMAFGTPTEYAVLAIDSAFRRLLQVVMERANSIGGLPHMKSIHIGNGEDGNVDLAFMKAEVLRSSTISKEIFEIYAKGLLTVGMFAKLQGKTPVEVAIGWPMDGPPLFVSHGTADEQSRARELLKRQDAVYVMDSLTIAELANLGIAEILAGLPRVLVSPLTKAILEERLRAAEDDRSVATTMEIGGELAIVEHNAQYHQKNVELCKALLAIVDQYCIVQPAYGELDLPSEHARIIEVLEDEEIEVLLLAKSQNATVVTLDGRLRTLLESFASVPGVWPQALLMYCAEVGLTEPSAVCRATIRLLLNNRTFVCVNSGDLVWMVLQGGGLLQHGMQRFKQYFGSNEAEFLSTAKVGFEFLSKVSKLKIHLGAFGELFEHVVEAALRNPLCPDDFIEDVASFVMVLTEELNGPEHIYHSVNGLRARRLDMQRRYLAERLRKARALAMENDSSRPIAVRTIFCSPIPWIVEDRGSAKEEVSIKVGTEADGTASAKAIERALEEPSTFVVAPPPR